MQPMQSRRHFLTSLTAVSAVSVLDARPALADEPPPETTTIRLLGDVSICQAPWIIVDDLLRAEGFTDVRYLYPSESVWIKKRARAPTLPAVGASGRRCYERRTRLRQLYPASDDFFIGFGRGDDGGGRPALWVLRAVRP